MSDLQCIYFYINYKVLTYLTENPAKQSPAKHRAENLEQSPVKHRAENPEQSPVKQSPDLETGKQIPQENQWPAHGTDH